MQHPIEAQARACFQASFAVAALSTAQKNAILLALADAIESKAEHIYAVNAQEVQQAAANGLPAAMTDRLTLTPARFEEMVQGVRKVAALPDPVNRVYDGRTLPSGLSLHKRSVPFGVVGVIYESRPNVTVDIAALCLKSGNACLLRGGKEALQTNSVLADIIASVLKDHDVPAEAVSFIRSTQREDVKAMLQQDKYIDLIIPRGGESLQIMCRKESSIPVITGGFGISHMYVSDSADLERSVPVIVNAKVQKPSACNALDTLLVQEKVFAPLMEKLLPALAVKKVVLHVHGPALAFFKEHAELYPAELIQEGRPEDFDREWLSLAMNVAVVPDVMAAILHLREHGASHSDAILTDRVSEAQAFMQAAGSACVYLNASTRFTDGGQFGLGAEVAISTQKLHARGPLGLEELTTYRYECSGDYLSRA